MNKMMRAAVACFRHSLLLSSTLSCRCRGTSLRLRGMEPGIEKAVNADRASIDAMGASRCAKTEALRFHHWDATQSRLKRMSVIAPLHYFCSAMPRTSRPAARSLPQLNHWSRRLLQMHGADLIVVCTAVCCFRNTPGERMTASEGVKQQVPKSYRRTIRNARQS
jgi:hypothetical protein